MDAPQGGLLNSQEMRERWHAKLLERAHAANEASEHAKAEALFLEAWRLLRRPSVLISATNMMVRRASTARPQALAHP